MTNIQVPPSPFQAQAQTLIQAQNTQSGHKLFLHQPVTGQTYDITDFWEEGEYNYDYKTAWREINVSLYDLMYLHAVVAPGDFLILMGPRLGVPGLGAPGVQTRRWTAFAEIDRAQIVTVDEEISDTGSFRVIAKTTEWFLSKNTLPYRMPKGTLSARLRFLEGQGHLTLDNALLETTHVLPATRGGVESIWEDIVYDLGETNRVENKKYVLRQNKGIFYLADVTDQPYKVLFEIGGNIFSMTKSRSIEDMFNEIYIIANADEKDSILQGFIEEDEEPTSLKLATVAFARNPESQFFYGRHIKLIKEEPAGDGWQISAQAQADFWLKKLSKVSVTADMASYSIFGVLPHDQVMVYEPVTDTVGVFWVRSGQHTIKNGDVVMSLSLDLDSIAPDSLRDKVKTNVGILQKLFDNETATNLTPEEIQSRIDAAVLQ